MKVIFLGTNGWFTTETGNTPCILIDSKTHYVVFDAGNGIYKLDKYITENKPIALFISHFHIDHVSGLHSLAKFKFPQGIDIYFAKGRIDDFNTLVNPPFTIGISDKKENISKLNTEIRVHEISGKQSIGFPAETFEMFHAYQDNGYRVTLENKTIAYSGDSGICPNSYLLAENADLLIHECSYIEAEIDDKWGHVDATKAADLAKKANAKKLALTHFDASKFNTHAKREEAGKKAKDIFSNTIVAFDDLVLEI